MRTLLTILQCTGRKLVVPAGVAVLLVTGGCGLTPNDDEGEPEPTLAEYRVSIKPSTVVLTKESPKATVTLSVQCIGDHLPLGCADNDPTWSYHNPAFFLVTSVDDETKATTKATLSLDTDLLAQSSSWLGSNSLLGAQGNALIAFFPEHVPEKLRLTGQRWVAIQYPLGLSGDVRQEESSIEPVLKITPRPLIMRPVDTGPITEELQIIYKGPPTDLLDVVLSSTVSAKFRLGRPTLPLAMGKLFSVVLPVTFLGLNDSNDSYIYIAEVTVIAENGARRSVLIQAYR